MATKHFMGVEFDVVMTTEEDVLHHCYGGPAASTAAPEMVTPASPEPEPVMDLPVDPPPAGDPLPVDPPVDESPPADDPPAADGSESEKKRRRR